MDLDKNFELVEILPVLTRKGKARRGNKAVGYVEHNWQNVSKGGTDHQAKNHSETYRSNKKGLLHRSFLFIEMNVE